MKSLLWIAIAMLLVTAFVAACGGDDATQAPATATAEATPPGDDQATTDEDGQDMTGEGDQATTDEDGQDMTGEGDQATTDEDGQDMTGDDGQDMTGDGNALSPECVPGGTLTDPEIISGCSSEALQNITSFAFDAKFDITALFPVDLVAEDGMDGGEMDAMGEGAMTFSGAVVFPESLSFSISLGLGDEAVEINGITIGADNYIQDPEAGLWVHTSEPVDDFFAVTSQPGLLLHPQEEGAVLTETAALDGEQVYALVAEATETDEALMPGQAVTRFVGVDDFLPKEIRIRLVGFGDSDRDIVTIMYHSYNSVGEIEPPANFIAMPAMPDEAMSPGSGESPTVLGLTSNENGDIEVMFSEPVFVEGTVGLYILDLSTGGWEIPLVGGSGTDTLTFDADAEGTPQIVAGEHQIGGITFPEADSEITDADGNLPILNFEPWTYE